MIALVMAARAAVSIEVDGVSGSHFYLLFLLLARLMGQYCFAGWRLSLSVVCRRRRL